MAGVKLTVDLAEVGRELKGLDKAVATRLRRQIRQVAAESGAALVTKMRANASWSTRIPAATGVKVSFGARSAGMTVATSARRAPHARPLEKGNATSYDPGTVQKLTRGRTSPPALRRAQARMRARGSGTSKMLRHPVYGHMDRWATQPTRPFFFPAVDESTAGIIAAVDAAVAQVIRDAGFKGA